MGETGRGSPHLLISSPAKATAEEEKTSRVVAKVLELELPGTRLATTFTTTK